MHGRYPHLRLIAIMSFALGFLVLPGPIKSVQAQESALIVNADELSPERFRELFPRFPDSAVIESHGKRTTVGEIRAKLQEQQAAIEVELERLERRALADLEKHRAAFHESEKARLDEARKGAFAAFERLSGTSPVVSTRDKGHSKRDVGALATVQNGEPQGGGRTRASCARAREPLQPDRAASIFRVTPALVNPCERFPGWGAKAANGIGVI
jgi:hypothetical protein